MTLSHAKAFETKAAARGDKIAKALQYSRDMVYKILNAAELIWCNS